jgi:hypothetical protein
MTLIAIRLIEVIDQEVKETSFVSFEALADYAGAKKGAVREKDDKSLIRNQLREAVLAKKNQQ